MSLRPLCLLILAVSLAGCTGGAGGFTVCPTGHELTTTTERVRECGPCPCQVELPRELQKTVLPAYIVEPGDGLLIEPVTLNSPIRFPSDQTVLADGTIDLGAYGRPVVAGQTLEGIEAIVNAAIWRVEQTKEEPIDEEDAQVNVRLINPQSKVFYVLGEVNAPGAYPLSGRETVLDGIIAAGGLTNAASPCDIILSRPTPPPGCRVVLNICYRQIIQLGDTTTNYQLRPGDRIYVATRSCWENMLPFNSKKDCPHCSCQPQCPCPNPCYSATEPDVMYHAPGLILGPGEGFSTPGGIPLPMPTPAPMVPVEPKLNVPQVPVPETPETTPIPIPPASGPE